MLNIIFTIHAEKPTCFSIKVWVIAEAKTGYVSDYAIYTGGTDGKKTTNLGQDVVLKLMKQYRGKGHCLFVDNFYTSPSQLLELLDQGTYCTSTVHINRKGFSKELLTSKEYPSGTLCYAVCKQNSLLAFGGGTEKMCSWLLQCIINPSSVMKHPKGEQEKKETLCPTAIIDYNNYMGRVNLADQMLGVPIRAFLF